MSKVTPTYLRLSYQTIHQSVALMANEIKRTVDVDLIVAFQRGGLVPGVIMSHQLDLPMVSIEYSSKAGNGDNRNHHNTLPTLEAKNILLVDDIVDSGYTMQEVQQHYASQGHTCYVAAVCYKFDNPAGLVPDFGGISLQRDAAGDYPWVVFPFEETD